MSAMASIQEATAGPHQEARDKLTVDALGEHAVSIDPELERRVLRKIDLFLMPAMMIGSSWIIAISFPSR